jgi:hypothetical protein
MNQDSFEDADAVGTAAEGAPSYGAVAPGAPSGGVPSGGAPGLALELGDFLNRIPPGALREGPHDPTLKIDFDLAWLETRIQQRDSTVPLSELYARAPHIFRDAELANSDVPVRLPYLKVTRMLAQQRSAAGFARAATPVAPAAPATTPTPEPAPVPAAGLDSSPGIEAEHHPEEEVPPAESLQTAVEQREQTSLHALSDNEDVPEVEELPLTPEQQVERLRKRLQALEGMQRNTAQELGRERDTRIKAERQAMAAETALLEARRQNEDGSSAESPAAAGKPGAAGWEWRAVKQLEADIETYRNRIRALLSERDTLQEKNVQLLRQLESPPEPPVTISAPGAGGPAPASPSELQNRIAQLKQERAALEKARQEALQQLEEARQGVDARQQQEQFSPAELEARQQELDSLRGKLEAAGLELAQLKSEREQFKAERDQLLEAKRAEGEAGDRASSIS